MVLFVAQNPKTRTNLEQPLHGTRSGKTFERWLKLLGDPNHAVINASQTFGPVTWKDYDLDLIRQAYKELGCTRAVALGKYAAGALERLEIPFFELPHPSGLSRKLNDKTYLASQLQMCRTYLQSIRS